MLLCSEGLIILCQPEVAFSYRKQACELERRWRTLKAASELPSCPAFPRGLLQSWILPHHLTCLSCQSFFPLLVQVLNAGKNKLTKMDEVASLTSLGALILNGNAMDEYQGLSVAPMLSVSSVLNCIWESLQFLMQITIFLPSASLIGCNSWIHLVCNQNSTYVVSWTGLPYLCNTYLYPFLKWLSWLGTCNIKKYFFIALLEQYVCYITIEICMVNNSLWIWHSFCSWIYM